MSNPKEILERLGFEDIREHPDDYVDGERFSEAESNRTETMSFDPATHTWEGFGWNNDEDGERIHESPVYQGAPEAIDAALRADRANGVNNPGGIRTDHIPVLLP